MSRVDVIVIGAGVNGLAAAASLARKGRSVLVLERRDEAGGLAAGHEFHPGYRTAGTLQDSTLLQSRVVDELQLERHGLRRTDGPPGTFAPQRDGPGLLIAHDPDEAASEIAAHSARDAERYREYRAFLGRIGPVVRRVLDAPPPDAAATTPWELAGRALAFRRLGARDMMEVLRAAPMCTADWLREWFETELLGCALGAPALVAGSSGPWAPATNALLLRHAALVGRAAVGGPRAIGRALLAAAAEPGAEVRTSCEVTALRFGDGRAQGVTLASGEEIDAADVVVTVDPRVALLDWVPPSECTPEVARRITRYRAAGSTAVVHLALNAPLRFASRPDLNVQYAVTGETFDDVERAFDPVKYGRDAERPFLEIHVPSVAEAELAPPGHAVVSILAHSFAGSSEPEVVGDRVVAVLEETAPGVTATVVGRQVLLSAHLAERLGSSGGHLLHGDHGVDQLLARPSPECSGYGTPWPGLWLGGGGSWPGGGITGLPGLLAAERVLSGRMAQK